MSLPAPSATPVRPADAGYIDSLLVAIGLGSLPSGTAVVRPPFNQRLICTFLCPAVLMPYLADEAAKPAEDAPKQVGDERVHKILHHHISLTGSEHV